MNDISSTDGAVPNIDGPKDGVFFQSWDKAAGRVAYNDGKKGLQKLDYVIKRAADKSSDRDEQVLNKGRTICCEEQTIV